MNIESNHKCPSSKSFPLLDSRLFGALSSLSAVPVQTSTFIIPCSIFDIPNLSILERNRLPCSLKS